MYGADGVQVAGDRYMAHDDAGTAKARTATAAYRRPGDGAEPLAPNPLSDGRGSW